MEKTNQPTLYFANTSVRAGRQRRFLLSCVVPVFNEGPVVGEFLEMLHRCVRQFTPDVELIVVDDGSTDTSSGEILHRADHLPLRYFELSRNFGKEYAIQAGLDVARGDCVLIIDADFQHPLELIGPMIERWQRGIDMVYAVKADRRGEPLWRRAMSALFYRMISLETGLKIPPDAGDFRLLDRKIVEVLRALPERTRFMKGLYAWVGFKSEAIPFHPAPRRGGVTKFSGLRLARLATAGLTAFSSLPLRFVSLAGLMMSVCAVGMSCWIVFEKLFLHQSIPGFATVAASVSFLSGIQLLALGIVGEYVGRIFDEVKRRPPYVVARTLDTTNLSRSAAMAAEERSRA